MIWLSLPYCQWGCWDVLGIGCYQGVTRSPNNLRMRPGPADGDVPAQGCSKVGPGHSKPETRRPRSALIATPAELPPIELGQSRNSELPPITQMGADNKAGRQAGRLRHGLFPICEYRRHLRLRNSDFGLLSGFGLRSSDFRAAEHDLPSTGRSLEQPWPPPKLCQFRLTI